jgi:hypothetical protein
LFLQLDEAAGVRVNLKPPRVAVTADGLFARSRDGARSVDALQQVQKAYREKVRIVFRDYRSTR